MTGAEWFDGADPGQGLATAAQPADGAFDSPVEDVTADVGTLSPGTHTISVRARDSAGNWGAVQTVTVTVDSPGLFADSFASGDLSAWSGRRGAGMLAVTPWAALDGDGYGMRAKVTGSAVAGVVDQSPAASPATTPGSASIRPAHRPARAWVVFAGWDGGGRVVLLRYRTVVHRVFLRASAIGISGWESTRWTRVSDDVHVLDLTWQAGSPGSVTLAVDGTPAGSVGDLGNGERRLERVMLGPSGRPAARRRGRAPVRCVRVRQGCGMKRLLARAALAWVVVTAPSVAGGTAARAAGTPRRDRRSADGGRLAPAAADTARPAAQRPPRPAHRVRAVRAFSRLTASRWTASRAR